MWPSTSKPASWPLREGTKEGSFQKKPFPWPRFSSVPFAGPSESASASRGRGASLGQPGWHEPTAIAELPPSEWAGQREGNTHPESFPGASGHENNSSFSFHAFYAHPNLLGLACMSHQGRGKERKEAEARGREGKMQRVGRSFHWLSHGKE